MSSTVSVNDAASALQPGQDPTVAPDVNDAYRKGNHLRPGSPVGGTSRKVGKSKPVSYLERQ